MKLISILIICTGLLILFFLMDCVLGQKEILSVLILDKIYEPARAETSVHTSIDINGNPHVTTSINYIAEKFILLVKEDNQKVFSHEVEKGFYAECKINKWIKLPVRIGKWSKIKY